MTLYLSNNKKTHIDRVHVSDSVRGYMYVLGECTVRYLHKICHVCNYIYLVIKTVYSQRCNYYSLGLHRIRFRYIYTYTDYMYIIFINWKCIIVCSFSFYNIIIIIIHTNEQINCRQQKEEKKKLNIIQCVLCKHCRQMIYKKKISTSFKYMN